jgi:hypothetical protein
MSSSITGSWTYKGCVIPKNPDYITGWTNHQSFVEYKGQWYAFYHTALMSGGVSAQRSICVDKLSYNSDGTMKQVIPTSYGAGTSAYSRIKAQFYSYMSGIGTEPCGGGDIGKRVKSIHNGDTLGYYLDFGSIGASSFEAQVASNNSNGGTIEIWLLQDRADTKIGSVQVDYTGGWGNNAEEWTTVSRALDYKTYYNNMNIELRFVGGSGGLMNLNWFRFKPTINIPVGYSVAFKSNNSNADKKYLCADSHYGDNPLQVYASRDAVGGAWEKFSILTAEDGLYDGKIQLNSSNNGKNLKLWMPSGSGSEESKFIYADGHDYFSLPLDSNTVKELIRWKPNNDGTMTLQHKANGKYLCADSNYNPALLVADRDEIGDWERFYAEVADAPIGCVVGFRSKGDTDSSPYLGAKSTSDYTIVATKSDASTDYRKFLVVDAGNGFVALKMLANNKYIDVSSGKAMADNDTITDYTKFQWINNGNGTITLECARFPSYYLSINSSDMIVCNYYSNYWNTIDLERFYCQIVKP